MSIESVKEKLRGAVDRGSLSHAYIITGGSADARGELALWLASAMQCTGANAPCGLCSGCRKTARGIHPDVSYIISEKQQITVDLIREMAAQSILRPNEGRRRIFIIPESERLNTSAQNAMLKGLEEPPASAAFILLTENPRLLLQTVRSRCALLSITPEGDTQREDDETAGLVKTFIKAVTEGEPLDMAVFCASLERKKRDELRVFLLAAMEAASAAMQNALDDRAGLRRLYSAQKALGRAYEFSSANVGTAHIAGYLSVSL